jgi:hypothetical protein
MNDQQRAAMQMALNVLEELGEVDSGSDIKDAITALREALAEPVKQEPVAEAHSGNLRWLIPDEEQPANAKLFLHPSESRFNATYENGAPMYSKTIVKENGDPIMLNKDGTRSIFCDVDDGCEAAPVQPVQEPVAVVEITYGREPECYVTGNIDNFPEGVFKLYAAPVERQWVDLTDDEIDEAYEQAGKELRRWQSSVHGQTVTPADFLENTFARAVVAAFKEKNR